MTNKNLEQLERQIAHLDKYRNNFLVRKVTLGETGFLKEVKEFYGVNRDAGHILGLGVMSVPRAPSYFKDEESKKQGQIPQDLVEVLDEFGEKPLSRNLLEYTSVREAYQGMGNSNHAFSDFNFSEFCTVAAGVAGGLVGIKYDSPGLVLGSLVLGLGSASCLSSLRKNRERKLRESRKSNKKEFLKLYEHAEIADTVVEIYRKNLLMKELNK